MDLKKPLYKCEKHGMVAGVCAGFAEYLNIDVTWVRFAAVFLVLVYGAGLFGYIIAAIIMPLNPEHKK